MGSQDINKNAWCPAWLRAVVFVLVQGIEVLVCQNDTKRRDKQSKEMCWSRDTQNTVNTLFTKSSFEHRNAVSKTNQAQNKCFL